MVYLSQMQNVAFEQDFGSHFVKMASDDLSQPHKRYRLFPFFVSLLNNQMCQIAKKVFMSGFRRTTRKTPPRPRPPPAVQQCP